MNKLIKTPVVEDSGYNKNRGTGVGSAGDC